MEEFRASQYHTRGALLANTWYLKHVFSILWQLIRPCVLTVVAMQVVFSVLLSHAPPDADGLTFLVFKSLWYGSPVGATTSFIGFTSLFVAVAVGSPRLLVAPLFQPFIFVILFVMVSMALGYGILLGILGGMIGRWVAAIAPRERRTS